MGAHYFPDIATPEPPPRRAILVVEDETALRVVVCRMLMLAGYDTVEAHDGRQALRILRQREAPVDLVLTDLVMPVMDGGELAARLATDWPNVSVLGMSAYAPVVHKPFSSAVLLEHVKSMIRY